MAEDVAEDMVNRAWAEGKRNVVQRHNIL